MKLITSTVTHTGRGEEHWNKKRLKIAELALEKAIKLGARVLVLPAEFFTTYTSRARKNISSSLINIAKRLNIAVVFGVDQIPKNHSKNWKQEICGKGLPWYGYAWSPTENIKHCWSQRSYNSTNQEWSPEKRCNEVRLFRVGNKAVGVLMCGEIFNERIRKALAKYHPKLTVVIDVAHYSQGFRVHAGMKILAKKYRLASVCSVHAECRYATKYCYLPQKGALSSWNVDGCVKGPPRIELKLWSF